MNHMPPLPPGFQLEGSGAEMPPLPPGFQIEDTAPAAPSMYANPNLTGLPGPFGMIAGAMGLNGMPQQEPESGWQAPGALVPIQFPSKAGEGMPRLAMPGILSSALNAAALPGEVASGQTPFDPRVAMQDQDPATLDRAATLALNASGSTAVAPSKAAVAVPKVPTVAGMFAKGDAKMAAVEATKAVVSQPAAASYVTGLRGMLSKEGLITPSGKVANYPSVSHAVSLAEDFATGNMTMANAKALRTALGDVAGAATKAERRVGVQMIKQLDDFMAKLKPSDFVAGNGKAAVKAWEQARAAYHVAFKGETVEKLISTAARKKSKFSGSGHENALRNQFDAFVGKEKNLRGYSPAERAQLSRVATGTGFGNVTRGMGKLAPTGIVSGGLTTGVPFGIGTVIGGPAMGTAAMVGSLTLGTIGRVLATMSTKHQAELARLIVLNGGKIPTTIPKMLPPAVKQALGNIILMGGAKAPDFGAQIVQALTQNANLQPSGS